MIKFTERRKDFTGTLSIGVIKILFYLLLTFLFLFLANIFIEGIGVISLEFIFDAPRNNMTEGGIGPAIFGTIAVTLMMVLFAVPLGVFAAIYLNEYAKNNFFNRLIRTSVNNLAGVPSIVFGLFGLGFFILFLGRGIDEIMETGLLLVSQHFYGHLRLWQF